MTLAWGPLCKVGPQALCISRVEELGSFPPPLDETILRSGYSGASRASVSPPGRAWAPRGPAVAAAGDK
jgi:hypothetical protein